MQNTIRDSHEWKTNQTRRAIQMSTKTAPKNVQEAEENVRIFIQWRAGELTADEKLVAKAQKALDAATDPVQQMKLHVDLVAAQQVDGPGITENFITSAPVVAGHYGFDGLAFEQVHGIPRSILKEAGFEFGRSVGNRTRVSRDTIAASIPKTGTFTVSELAETSGASVATVAKVVKDLVKSEGVISLGTDKDRNGRGKPPEVFQTA